MRLPRRLLLGMACLSPGRLAAQGDGGTLLDPSAEDVVLLYFALRDLPPPLERWRRGSPEIGRADEFHRAAAIDEFDRRITARVRSLRGVRGLRIGLRGEFSVYDSVSACFYLSGLSEGSTVPYAAFDTNVALRPVDGGEWNMWPLPPTEAERVLLANGGHRDVTLLYALGVVADQSRYPADREIAVTIQAIDILGADGRTRLGVRRS